jgi:hypothetical protein
MARRRTTLFTVAGLTAGLVAAGNSTAAGAGDPMPENVLTARR